MTRKMKKLRGLRRYYKNLAIKNDFELCGTLDYMKCPDAWFDRGHWHFDWWGLGNNSFKRRRPHLDKLFRHFEILIENAKWIKTEFQLFALILDNNSESDAVYLHSPNPNNSDFPIVWDDLSEECTLKNNDLIAYLDQLTQYDKLYGVRRKPFCILIPKNVGWSKILWLTSKTQLSHQRRK